MDGQGGSSRVAGLFTGRYAWITLGCAIVIIAGGFEVTAISVVMPTVARDLNGLSLYSAGFAVAVAFTIVGIVIAGPWGDAKGPYGPLYTGVIIAIIGLVSAGFAHSMAFFLAARAVQGLGIGLINVSAYVVIGREMPQHLHSPMFAVTSISWLLPAVVGPVIGGLLVDTVGWRWAFWGVAPIMLTGTLILSAGSSVRQGDDTAQQTPSRKEWMHRVWRAAAISLSVALMQPAGNWARAGYTPFIVVGVIVLFGIIIVAARRLLPAGTLVLQPGLPSLMGVRAFLAGSYFAFELYIPFIGQTFRHFSPTISGFIVTSGSISWAIASVFQSRLPASWNRGRVLTATMSMSLGGLALATSLVNPAVPLIVPILGWSLAGCGVGVAYPLNSVMVLALSEQSQIGVNSSALSMSEQVGIATSMAVGGLVFTILVPHSLMVATIAYCCVCLLYGSSGVLAASRTKVH